MRPLPGLTDRYNRAASVIGRALPQPERTDDPFMLLVHSLEAAAQGPNAGAVAPLIDYIRACEEFDAAEYGPPPAYAGTSLRELWLPLLFLGDGWRDYVEAVLGIPAKHWDGADRADAIVLRPVTVRDPCALKVRLREAVPGVKVDQFKEFERSVKGPFGLRTRYVRQNERLEFLDGASRILTATAPDTVAMISGKLPPWLAFLLGIDAVERIELSYPHEAGPTLRSHIAGVVALPSCPVSASNSDEAATELLSSCHTWLGITLPRKALGQAVFVAMTSQGEEWYRLLDCYLRHVHGLVRHACGFPEASDGAEEPAAAQQDLEMLVLRRRIALPPGADLRRDSEFTHLRSAFGFSTDQDGKGVLHSNLAISSPTSFLDAMQERIGDLAFLKAVATNLRTRCERLMERDGSQAEPSDQEPDAASEPTETHSPAVSSTRTGQSGSGNAPRSIPALAQLSEAFAGLGFAMSAVRGEPGPASPAPIPSASARQAAAMSTFLSALLQSTMGVFRQNLDIAIEVLTCFELSRTASPLAAALRDVRTCGETSDISKVLGYLLRCGVHGRTPRERSLALAGVVYMLDPNDTVPDDGPSGFHDDEFGAAVTLRLLENAGTELPGELSDWALDRSSEIDSYLTQDVQEAVMQTVEQYVAFLNNGTPEKSKRKA